MEYPTLIEYVRDCEHAIANALLRLNIIFIDAEMLAKLAKGVHSYACPISEANLFNARVD